MSRGRSLALLLAVAAGPSCSTPRDPAALACPGDMVLVPACSFRMGSDAADPHHRNDETPAREVRLSAYCLDRHEMTEAEWQALAPEAPPPACADCPVTGITWSEADRACRARGGRLPSEAEMEAAIRAGTTSIYPWGPSWPPPQPSVNARDRTLAAIEPLWVPETERGYDDGRAALAPACAGGADARGLCDLLGNAAEWCADRYSAEEYAFASSRDPRGPRLGRAHAVRGGSFADGPRELRAAARASLGGEMRSLLVGLRCASEPRLAPAPEVRP